MPNTPETPEIDSTALARKAINHVLQQIKKNPDIRYHMGAFTESFELLKAAHSALTGISEESIEKDVFSVKFTRKPAAQKIDEIRDITDSCESNPRTAGSDMARIAEICRS